MAFQTFQLSKEVKRAVDDAGYTEPTEIQEKSIPIMLSGKDIIGFSQTGSGKTAAFGLPAIDMIDLDMSAKQIQVLILCPTRELAMQAQEELLKFSKYKKGLHVVSVYGGQPIDRQIIQLRRGCQIVVGTPGRIMDHMRRRTIRLESLKLLILDEADEMLNMGFREDIETILEKTPEDRQTVLFSATMPQAILDITSQYQKNPEMIQIKRKEMTVSTIEQSYFDVPRGRKKDALALLLQYYHPTLSIVFCNTKKMTDEVCEDLENRGYRAAALHGDMKQQARTQVMNRFKNGGYDILVATDVAARGIDVNNIDIVFNFDIPQDPEYYVHRIGRTGRAGKEGRSFTLIQGRRQLTEMKNIMHYAKCHIERRDLPMVSDIKAKIASDVMEEIKTLVAKSEPDKRREELHTLEECGYSAETVALALLDRYLKKKEMKQHISEMKPVDYQDEFPRERRERPKKERRPNPKAQAKFANMDMEKITISIGRNDKVAPKHILGAVAGESGLPGSMMGTIDIQKSYTTVDVPKEHRIRIIKALNNSMIKNKKVYVK